MAISVRKGTYSVFVALATIVCIVTVSSYLEKSDAPSIVSDVGEDLDADRTSGLAATMIEPSRENSMEGNSESDARFFSIMDAIESIPQIPGASERYRSNIDAAQDGSSEAQFEIARSMQTCSNAIRIRDLQKRIDDAQTQEDVLIALQKENAMCTDLHEHLSDSELEQGARGWLRMAAASGHPLADIYLSFERGFDPNVDTVELFRAAIASENPDVFAAVHTYVAMYQPDNQIDYIAWNILSCKTRINCPVKDVVHEFVNSATPYLAETVQSRLVEIEENLAKKNWSEVSPINHSVR